eukprot:888497-Amphidinium_carterae.1
MLTECIDDLFGLRSVKKSVVDVADRLVRAQKDNFCLQQQQQRQQQQQQQPKRQQQISKRTN